MEVQLLGGVAVAGDLGSVPIDAPLARRCVGGLALSSGMVTLDGLADMLWGDALPTNWKQALRNVIAKVRVRLDTIGGGGDAVIVTTPTGYRLAGNCTVDVHAALRRADAAEEAAADGDPDRALGHAMSALPALNEPLLPDVDADWVSVYRTRIEWARSRSLQVGAAAGRSIGRFAQAIDLARQAVAGEPLSEESHRELIASHAAANDRAAALRAYEDCRRTLATELGIVPDRATTDLYLSVLGREPDRPTRLRSDKPLFGRTDELTAMRQRVEAGFVVTVVGPGGIGKSHLTRAFTTDPQNGFEGNGVFVEVAGLDASQLLTALTATLGVPAAGSDDGLEKVQRELAGRGRTLLVLDDADQVADGVANLAVALSSTCPETAVIVTCRVALGLDIERLLRLGPLDPDGAGRACFIANAASIGQALGDDDATQTAVAAVCRAVGGSPLGIELAARQASDVSLADLADRLGTDRFDAEGRSTPLVQTVVDSTIALLDQAELAVFQRLSVIGGPADLALIQATVADEHVPAGRVVRILAQLAERALVRLDRTTVRWTYDQHPVLRSAGRGALTPADVRQINDRLATALFARLPPKATDPPRVGEITGLLPAIRGLLAAALAGEADPATGLRLAYWLHRFWAATALDEGRRWLQRLLDATTEKAPDRGHAEFALGYLLVWSGRPDEAAVHLEAAAGGLDATDPLLPGAHYFLANTAENRRPAVARHHYAAAVRTASEAGLDDLATRCSIGLAILEFDGGDRAAGLARYEAAVRAIESAGVEDAVVLVLPQYAWMLISVARLDDAFRMLQRVERALGDEERITTMVAAAARARLERHLGRPDVARRHAERAMTMIERAGVGRLDGLVSPTLALVDLSVGHVDAAVAELARGVKSALEAEQFAFLADILDAATLVSMALGRVDEAVEVQQATEALRRRAQVQRGDLEQAELDATLARIGVRLPSGADRIDDIDVSRVADLVVGMAAV